MFWPPMVIPISSIENIANGFFIIMEIYRQPLSNFTFAHYLYVLKIDVEKISFYKSSHFQNDHSSVLKLNQQV